MFRLSHRPLLLTVRSPTSQPSTGPLHTRVLHAVACDDACCCTCRTQFGSTALAAHASGFDLRTTGGRGAGTTNARIGPPTAMHAKPLRPRPPQPAPTLAPPPLPPHPSLPSATSPL
jgi:hypothetical protein